MSSMWSLRRGVLSALLVAGTLPFIGARQGCAEASSDVAQERIYTFYWLYVDANADATQVRAQFRFGNALGTTLELEKPAGVTVNDQDMHFNDLLLWHETTIAGEVEDAHFVYTDANGDTFENHVGPAKPLVVTPGTNLTIDRSHAFTLPLTGEPLGAGETIEVTVQSVDSPVEFQVFLEHEREADSIVLTQDKLDRLPTGAARIIVKRHSDSTPSQKPEGGGKVTVTYQAKDAAAVIVE